MSKYENIIEALKNDIDYIINGLETEYKTIFEKNLDKLQKISNMITNNIKLELAEINKDSDDEKYSEDGDVDSVSEYEIDNDDETDNDDDIDNIMDYSNILDDFDILMLNIYNKLVNENSILIEKINI